MSYYLGIDGGGTKTICAVADESAVLGTVTGGPSNVIRVGEPMARESLQQAVRQACAAAGITPREVSRTCIGASGAGRPETAAVVRHALTELLHSPIDVTGDMEIALEAAFAGGSGVVVNAGTGSFAFGRNPQGTSARAGGWGFAISDEGSAQWIGRVAISTLLRDRVVVSPETDPHPSPLQQSLLAAWKLKSIDDLIRAANATPTPDFSALFSVVLSCAEAGDDIASQVLTNAGRELAGLADVVIRCLYVETNESQSEPASSAVTERVPVVMLGGVFRHALQVRQVFYNQLHALQPRIDLNRQVVEAVCGAISLARKADHRSVAAKG